MTKLEKLHNIIENSREVGVKLRKDVLQQVEELEEGIVKEETLPALGNDIAHSSSSLYCIKPMGLRFFKVAFCDLEACNSDKAKLISIAPTPVVRLRGN